MTLNDSYSGVDPQHAQYPGDSTFLEMRKVFDWVHADLAQVEQELKRYLNTDVQFLNAMTNHLVMAGGKRMRPTLAIYCGKLFDAEANAIHISAAALEYVHTATLLHDDVLDEAVLRRNRTAARLLWGNAPTVLGGDYLLACAFKALTALGNHEVLETISETTMQMAKGEILQLTHRFDNTSKAEYLRIISYKTACLFGAAAKVGAAYGTASIEQKEALYQFAHCLGLAFQITDDVLDYAQDSERLGKTRGADLKERKITLPLSLLLEMIDGTRLEQIKTWLQETVISDDIIEKISALMDEYDIFETCMREAKTYVDAGIEYLTVLPQHGYPHQALLSLANYAVNRHH